MEIELKLGLEQSDAGILRAHLGDPLHVRDQVNLYFDSRDGSLSRTGWALRLRSEVAAGGGPTAWTLTVKRAGEQVGGFSHRPEYERSATAEDAAAWMTDPRALAAAAAGLVTGPDPFPVSEVFEFGSIRNRRTTWVLDNVQLELDDTEWPDGTRGFELEIEVPDESGKEAAATAVRAMLEELGIEWRVASRSKLERLLEILGRNL